MRPLARLLVPLLSTAVVSAACSAEASKDTAAPLPPAEATPHSHADGEAMVSMIVGDGTQRSEVGYRLAHVHLPRVAGTVGEARFTILRHDGTPVRDYLPMQTKDLHLYVVRDDLTVFRHLHPTLDEDGVWIAPLTLPVGGRYRVIAELAAVDEGGNGDLVLLGTHAPAVRDAPDAAETDVVPAADREHQVSVEVEGDVVAGPEGTMTLVVRDREGRPVQLGSYLGSGAHVTGFHLDSGAVAHMHPLGPPEVADDGTRLTFHTELEHSGAYQAFVQLRVGGLLDTVPITLDVG